MKKQKRKPQRHTHYSLIAEMMASTTQPLDVSKRRHQLTRIWGGVTELAGISLPSNDAWQVCSDAVNLVETFVLCGPWHDCSGAVVDIMDNSGLLMDAIAALALAGGRMREGHPAGLSAAELGAIRAVVADYSDLADTLPARTMIRCHRATERRIYAVLDKIKPLPDGVHVVAI